jgi:hypothetical protein
MAAERRSGRERGQRQSLVQELRSNTDLPIKEIKLDEDKYARPTR